MCVMAKGSKNFFVHIRDQQTFSEPDSQYFSLCALGSVRVTLAWKQSQTARTPTGVAVFPVQFIDSEIWILYNFPLTLSRKKERQHYSWLTGYRFSLALGARGLQSPRLKIEHEAMPRIHFFVLILWCFSSIICSSASDEIIMSSLLFKSHLEISCSVWLDYLLI